MLVSDDFAIVLSFASIGMQAFSFLLRSYSSSEMLELFLSGISFSSYSSSGTTIGVELSFSIVYFAMSLSSGFSSRIF